MRSDRLEELYRPLGGRPSRPSTLVSSRDVGRGGIKFMGRTISGAAPALADFPEDRDWGYHDDGTTVYLVYNRAGTITYFPLASSGSASVSDALLSTVSSVDLNVTTKTTLYTVPVGKTAIITRVVIRNASTSLTTASYGVGFDAGGSDVITDATHVELTGNTLYAALLPKIGALRGVATDILGLKCSIAQGGAATVSVDSFGYLV